MNDIIGAYWAGFVDGEGTLGITKKKNPDHILGFSYVPYASISHTNLSILQELRSTFGGKIHQYKTHTSAFKNGKQVYQWWIDSKSMRNFLASIQPYLKLKSKQAKIISNYQELRSKHYKSYVPKVFWKVAEQAYQELKVLNRRGLH